MKTNTYLLTILLLIGSTQFAISREKKEPLSIEYNIKEISCHGVHDGKIEISIKGGHPPYIIAWDNCKSDLVLEGLRDGDYSVKVCDAKGNEVLQNFKLINPSPLSILFDTSHETYLEELDQRVNMVVTGGTPWKIEATNIYDIDINDKQDEQFNKNLKCLTITDAHGCKISKDVVLNFVPKRKPQENILNIIVEEPTETASLKYPE